MIGDGPSPQLPGRGPFATRPGLVPPWLERIAAVGWRVLACVVLGLVLVTIAIELASATASTLLALILAAALSPTVRRLRARGIGSTPAAAVACLAGGVAIVGAALLLVLAVVPDALAIRSAVRGGIEDLREALETLGLPEIVIATVDRLLASLADLVGIDVGALLGSAVSAGTVLVLGTFLTFFLLQDGDRGWAWLMRGQPAWRADPLTASARDGLDRIAWYLRRTALLAAVDAVVVGIVLVLAGVPLAGSLAVVVFLAGFVPYLGAAVAAAIVGLATLTLAGPPAAVAVLVALGVAWVVSTRLLERTPMNGRIDVHPVLVLVAMPAGATLFGLLGLIAALPVTVFVLAIARSITVALDLGPEAGTTAQARADAPPVWLDRLAQWSWRALIVVALGYVAIQLIVLIPSVVVPGLIAVIAASTLLPLVNRLAAAGWSRAVAAVVSTVGASVAVVVSVVIALAMTLGPLREVIDVAIEGADLLDLVWIVDVIGEIGSGVRIDAGLLLASAFGLLVALALAMLLTVFLLRDGPAWWGSTAGRLSAARREPVAEAGRRTVEVLSGYMVGTAIISAFGAFTSGAIMILLGLPLAVPIAILTFFASFIPYIGSAITTALAFLVAVALGDLSDIVIMGIYTVVFNIVQGSFIAPIVYGRSLSLHPAVVLMAIPVGGAIAGTLGMFLVVPLAAIVAATWRLVIVAIAAEPGATTGTTTAGTATPPAPPVVAGS
jgi:putative heme transporter